VNKKSKTITRLRYTYIPMPVREFVSTIAHIGNTFSRHYPLYRPTDLQFDQPVFIISSGRSGTTLMRSMLVAGGKIAIPAETQIIHMLPVKYHTTRGLGWEDQVRLIIASFESHRNFPLWQVNLAEAYQRVLALPENERSLARIINEVYFTYAAQAFPEAHVWGDQSPIHTFYLPYIKKVFPKARFMHLLRDGRDVVSSMVTRHGDDYLFEAVLRWKTSLRRISHFQTGLAAEQYIEVRYENLVREPEPTLQTVCSFIGIDYDPVMLDYWKLPTTIEHKYKTFHQNLGKPVFASSIGKWKERLNQQQQDYVIRNLAVDLHKLGYLEKSDG
jgi:protein-tyrosine sulfotransferase